MIDYRYFIHPKTRIAGIDTIKDGRPTEPAQRIINDIEAYISTYEPKFLKMLLGPNYESAIAKNKTLKRLLVNPDSGTSVIADYVYFHYIRDFSSFNTMSGEKTKDTDNSSPASANHRLVTIWNDMVEKCIFIIEEVEDDATIVPELHSEIFRPINIYAL